MNEWKESELNERGHVEKTMVKRWGRYTKDHKTKNEKRYRKYWKRKEKCQIPKRGGRKHRGRKRKEKMKKGMNENRREKGNNKEGTKKFKQIQYFLIKIKLKLQTSSPKFGCLIMS